jgi:hypothetical protein
MPTQILPAASLRSAQRLPAARALLRAASYLICTALWSIGRAICRVVSNFLPALREGYRYQAASSKVRSALHQLDADAIRCSEVAQEAAVYAFLQLDGKSHTLGPKLGAKGRQIAPIEKTEMVGSPCVMAGEAGIGPDRSGGLRRFTGRWSDVSIKQCRDRATEFRCQSPAGRTEFRCWPSRQIARKILI